ncbi:MAG: beta-ketoacyl synthase N-terminal-like domain-containing protein [Acidobacteriota bacterium]
MSALERRVVITGLGAVSSLGPTLDAHREGLAARLATTEPSTESPSPGGPVVGFAPRRSVHNRLLRKLLQPSALYAVGAVHQALAGTEGVGALDHPDARARCGVFWGSVSFELAPSFFAPALRASCDAEGAFDLHAFAERGLPLVDPLLIVKGLPNAALCGASIDCGLRGPTANHAGGETAGLQAVAAAVTAVAAGEVEQAIAGGSDSWLQPQHRAELAARGRRETASEGAAALLLESRELALHRGAPILGEVVGVGDAWGTVGDTSALEAAARDALGLESSIAGLATVFGDGGGTVPDRRREVQALERLGGPRFVGLAPALGFVGAAGGVFALVHAVDAVRQGLRGGETGPNPDDRVLAWVADDSRTEDGADGKAVAVALAPEPTDG